MIKVCNERRSNTLRKHYKSSAVAQMGDRLASIDMGRKLGHIPFLGEVGLPSNTMSPGPRPTSVPSGILIHPAIWPQRTWSENWGLCPLFLGGTGSPSNTTWVGPRPTTRHVKLHLDPSSCLATMHQRRRQDRQTRTDRQRSDRIG